MAHLTGIASLSDIYDSDEELVDMQKQLVNRVLKQVSSEDLVTIPIELLVIDWDKIKCGGMTKVQLKSAWEGILSKERLYRTGWDVLGSFMDNPSKQCSAMVKNWNQRYLSLLNSNSTDVWAEAKKEEETGSQENNLPMLKDKNLPTVKGKKGLKVNLKKYPSKPMSGYRLFCQEKLKMKLHMSQIAAMWKSMNDEEKAHYFNMASESAEKYLKDLEKFIQEYPDDDHAKDLHKRAVKAHSKPKNAKRAYTSDESVVSMPSEKKRKKLENPRKTLTGFDVYVKKKKEEITVENPDLDEEEIMKKLTKKYEKLSDSRKEKYEKSAKEMNKEG